MAATTPITKPTLTYGTRAGLAEPARVLLEDAGVDYDYVAIANWADVKAQYQASGKAPFGQFPFYEEPSGLVVAQSSAITRHLARQHAAEGVIDIRTRFVHVFHVLRTTDEEAKTKAKAQFLSEYFPSQLEAFTTLLAKNGNNGFLVGSKVSYADVLLWSMFSMLFTHFEGSKEVVAKYPAIQSFLNSIRTCDHIKAYITCNIYAMKASA